MSITVTDNLVVVQEVDNVVTVTTSNTVVPSAGGASDHDDLTGLLDDDHTQYHNDARGDARYYTQTQLDTALALKQTIDATLTALAGLTIAADKLIYGTGVDAFATTDFSAFMRTLLDDASAGIARATLGAATEIADGRVVLGGTTYYLIPGVEIYTLGTSGPGGNRTIYAPFVVNKQITIDQLAAEVTTLSAATTFSMGIYDATTSLQPGAAKVIATGLSSASLGIKTASINTILPPGVYLTAITIADNTVQFRRGLGASRFAAFQFGANAYQTRWQVATTVTLTDPGTAWVAFGSTGVGNEHHVWMRISVP